jgi:hypothetical protein
MSIVEWNGVGPGDESVLVPPADRRRRAHRPLGLFLMANAERSCAVPGVTAKAPWRRPLRQTASVTMPRGTFRRARPVRLSANDGCLSFLIARRAAADSTGPDENSATLGTIRQERHGWRIVAYLAW